MFRFNPVTRVTFFRRTSSYNPGTGQESGWEEVGSLYCEWKGGFGERAVSAQAMGVNRMATIRTFYHPGIYDCLSEDQTLIVRGETGGAISEDGTPDRNNPAVYELWGGVDNVDQANRFMEFRVRRYEGK